MEKKLNKLVVDEKIKLEYELTGAGSGLVQACGELAGVEIYFRAKDNEWTFDVAGGNGRLPSDGSKSGYFRKAKCKDAGYITPSEAEKIISRCVDDYLQQKNT